VALTSKFAELPGKQALWSAFLSRNPPMPPPSLTDLQTELRQFLVPVLATVALPEGAKDRWNPDRMAWE